MRGLKFKKTIDTRFFFFLNYYYSAQIKDGEHCYRVIQLTAFNSYLNAHLIGNQNFLRHRQPSSIKKKKKRTDETVRPENNTSSSVRFSLLSSSMSMSVGNCSNSTRISKRINKTTIHRQQL